MRCSASWLMALSLVAGGCAKRTAPAAAAPRLVEVRVLEHTEEAGEGAPAPVDAQALAARIGERVAASKLMAWAPGAAPAPGVDFRLAADVRQVVTQGDGGRVLRAFVAVRLLRIGSAAGEPPITSEAVAERAVPAGAPLDAAATRAHLERAVDDVLGSLLALARVHLGGAAELAAAFDASDDDVRAEAVRVAALRKDRRSVPRLLALLKSEDARQRDRALGALVEIGDPRAVKPITELARFQDVSELPKVIDALGALGGGEARAYLEFVVSAHDDGEMRQLAQAALVRLDGRTGTPAAAP